MRIMLLAAAMLAAVPASAAVSFAGKIEVAGNSTDLATIGSGPNSNRLSFGSDLFFDPRRQIFYGISDRGPGGGTIDWAPRIEQFNVDFSASGGISNFQLQRTTLFRQANGQVYSGLNPGLQPGGARNLGPALDSEGIVRLPNGNFLVADEYGPSIYEVQSNGRFVRAFTQPANILPRDASNNPDYANGRPTIVSGRQDNRGFEGLTISADGKTAWGILQDPLVNEGASNDGRRSQNLRIVQFDVATGQSTGQFIYQLEALASINARVPGSPFSATNQGRSIGVSSITWIGGTKFLVIERDNRGQGPDNLISPNGDIASKRVYMIDLAGATDVSGISLAGSNALPGGVTPVGKLLFLDVQAALLAGGETILPEKLEGLAIGPRLAGGGFALLLATDNDFSVTQNGSNVQFDVCAGGGSFTQVALGAACPDGQALIPSRIYSFAITGADAALFDSALFGVPEPASWAMLIAGFGLTGAVLRRRRLAIVSA
nr:esterase-like activity of phytase family protein [Sandarakinorhabdus oryzae]